MPVPALSDPALEPPWAFRSPEARAFRALASLLEWMSDEAAQHPDRYASPPDPDTLRALADVLMQVALQPQPVGAVREAMKRWKTTWVVNGGPEEQERLGWG